MKKNASPYPSSAKAHMHQKSCTKTTFREFALRMRKTQAAGAVPECTCMADYNARSRKQVADHRDTQHPLVCCRFRTADVRLLRPECTESGSGVTCSNPLGATEQSANARTKHNDDRGLHAPKQGQYWQRDRIPVKDSTGGNNSGEAKNTDDLPPTTALQHAGATQGRGKYAHKNTVGCALNGQQLSRIKLQKFAALQRPSCSTGGLGDWAKNAAQRRAHTTR